MINDNDKFHQRIFLSDEIQKTCDVTKLDKIENIG